ncbi:MAG: DUF2946 family protein [Alphaproteobacteria bacterium]|nr:DUF2946 family protein [Alphaproteobacteria bacterium]
MTASIRTIRLLRLLPAILWLTAQLGMSGVFGAQTASAATGDGVRSIVICTADGFARVALNADGQPVDPAKAIGSLCEWCQAFGAVVMPAAPADASILNLDPVGTVEVSADHDLRVGRPSDQPYPIRGPPL